MCASDCPTPDFRVQSSRRSCTPLQSCLRSDNLPVQLHRQQPNNVQFIPRKSRIDSVDPHPSSALYTRPRRCWLNTVVTNAFYHVQDIYSWRTTTKGYNDATNGFSIGYAITKCDWKDRIWTFAKGAKCKRRKRNDWNKFLLQIRKSWSQNGKLTHHRHLLSMKLLYR
jgi:hypothetical protein